ncbi:MAG TPA: GPW/gp25 family protein [Gemmataceae bacterium]|nr:GPW/gp25 family protein [Gemmataceae bacterium]
MANDFYGRGASYPLQLSPKGGIRESAGFAKVEESIRIILGTQYGERVMRPTFGCNLRSLAFAPNNAATAQLATFYVRDGLKRWEPRIDVQDVVVTNDNVNGLLLIEISYTVKASQGVGSLIYPFFLEQP